MEAGRQARRPDLYHVIGHSVALAGEVEREASSFQLRVLADEREVGWLGCSQVAGVGEVVISIPGGALPSDGLVEALRLFLRLASKLYGHSAGSFLLAPCPAWEGTLERGLDADGLSRRRNRLELDRRLEPTAGRKAPAGDMEAVYADPLTVPWNFIPVTVDLIDPLLTVAPSRARVLDLGCGFGKNLRYLVAAGARASGLDLAAQAVDRAREIAAGAEEVVVGSALALPWADGSFDTVLDAGCVHCLAPEARPLAIREAARVLVDGGQLYSAILPPKDPAWLDALPFVIDEIGMAPGQAQALLERGFDSVTLSAHPHITNLVASTPRRDAP